MIMRMNINIDVLSQSDKRIFKVLELIFIIKVWCDINNKEVLVMGFLCKDDRPFMLSSSSMGSISQCDCCNSYHVAIGNITLRMERKHLINLTQMIIDALEVKSGESKQHEDSCIRHQA